MRSVRKMLGFGAASAVVAGVVAVAIAAPVEPEPTLYETRQADLFPRLREFVSAPGTTPDLSFGRLRLGAADEPVLEDESTGEAPRFDQDGFWVIIKLEPVRGVAERLGYFMQYEQKYGCIVLLDQLFGHAGQVTRVVRCQYLKGDVHVEERRYFRVRGQTVEATLKVSDDPKQKRTASDLLALLRTHYGKYQGVCQRVAGLGPGPNGSK